MHSNSNMVLHPFFRDEILYNHLCGLVALHHPGVHVDRLESRIDRNLQLISKLDAVFEWRIYHP